MFEPLLGSLAREHVLLFIHLRGSGYSREISRFFGIPVDSVQKQLKRLQRADLLRSSTSGRTVIYEFNPECPYLKELRLLLDRMACICSSTGGMELSGLVKESKRTQESSFAIVKKL